MQCHAMPFSYLPILVSKICNDYMEECFQQIGNELFKVGRLGYCFLKMKVAPQLDVFFSGTNRVTIIQDDQAFNKAITNLHQEPNWEETSRQWRKQWIISCTFNILFSICILLVLLVLYYKRYAYY